MSLLTMTKLQARHLLRNGTQMATVQIVVSDKPTDTYLTDMDHLAATGSNWQQLAATLLSGELQ